MVAMIYELAIRESPIFSSIHLNQVQYASSSSISWAVTEVEYQISEDAFIE